MRRPSLLDALIPVGGLVARSSELGEISDVVARTSVAGWMPQPRRVARP